MDWINQMNVLKEKIKFQLNARKVYTLASLDKYFKETDTNKDGKISAQEFENLIKKLGIYLKTQELRVLYDQLDHDRDGQVTLEEFHMTLKNFKNDVSIKRVKAVKFAYNALDVEGKGFINYAEMQSKFVPSEHPLVRTKQSTVEQILAEFEANMGSKAKEGKVPMESFVEYYNDISSVLPTEKDDYFVDLIMRTWNLYKEGSSLKVEQQKKLETILFEKIRQRTTGINDEGKTMKKILKLYDIKDTGTVTLEQFRQALVSIGCTFSNEDFDELVFKFDKKGYINIDEISGYYALIGSGNNPNVKPKFEVVSLSPLQVLEKIKKLLISRGLYGVGAFGRLMRKIDKVKSGKINRKDFSWALQENGHALSPMEYERIFKHFDSCNTGYINYNNFIKEMRGVLNPGRKLLVNDTFMKITKGKQLIALEELIKCCNVSKHPKFCSGEMLKKDILDELREQFDVLQKGEVTIAEFEEFYNDVNASFEKDDDFWALIGNSWII